MIIRERMRRIAQRIAQRKDRFHLHSSSSLEAALGAQSLGLLGRLSPYLADVGAGMKKRVSGSAGFLRMHAM